MTVAELIAQLQEMPLDALVDVFAMQPDSGVVVYDIRSMYLEEYTDEPSIANIVIEPR